MSSMYLCQPSKEAVGSWKALVAEDTSILLRELKAALEEINPESEAEVDKLLGEYTQLFIGPYRLPCPPWESVYTSPRRLMMQEASQDVSSVYREFGLALDSPEVLPDHIGVELNFLAVLYEKISVDPGKRSDDLDKARRFLDEHLGRWIPQFTIDMERAAKSKFYKALGRVTREILLPPNVFPKLPPQISATVSTR